MRFAQGPIGMWARPGTRSSRVSTAFTITLPTELGDLDIGILPYPEFLHVFGVHVHDRAGVEVFLGRLACFHADTLLDGPARDHVEGNFLSIFSSAIDHFTVW